MPKYLKKEKKHKKGKKNLLQNQTDELINKKTRQLSPSPSVSSCESFHGFGNVRVKRETVDLRRQMEDLQKRIAEIDAQNEQNDVAHNEAESELSADEGENNKQLYGKNYKDEDMVLLKDEIYCRKRIFDMAKGCSFKPSHVARRLLEGVYTKEAILKSTLTGQPPKSQGRERQMGQYGCLNPRARSAIVEFSMERGKKKGWIVQNEYEINRALSQKIGELKRLYNRQTTK